MMKIKLIVCLGMFLACLNGRAQNNIPKVFPLSPQAGSLGNYGSLPIDLSTGRINYTIPIFTIKEGDFEYPINLSYNYSGLQAEDVIGHVGTGWTINSSGYISIQVRNFSDLDCSGRGYIGAGSGKRFVSKFYDYSIYTDKDAGNIADFISKGIWDTESDKYIVNCGNLNFSFYLNEDGEPIYNPYVNHKVEYTSCPTNFKITDDTGIEYFFNKNEYSRTESLFINNRPGGGLTDPPYISAFNLTSINLPENRTISFNYNPNSKLIPSYSDKLTEIDPNKNSTTQYLDRLSVDPCSQSGYFATRELVETNSNDVSEIVYSQGKVVFEYLKILTSNLFDTRLQKIKIYNLNNEIINYYEFVYDSSDYNKKLLVEVKKYDSLGNTIPFYKFNYYGNIPNDIPPTSQDFWGYYNGKSNQSLIKGDREPDFDHTLLGALQKVTYPTGGTSEIMYEQNKISEISFNGYYESTTFNSSAVSSINTPIATQINENVQNIYIPFKQIIKLELDSYAGVKNNTWIIAESSVSFAEGVYPKILSGENTLGQIPVAHSFENSWIDASKSHYVVYAEFGPGVITLNSKIDCRIDGREDTPYPYPLDNSANDISSSVILSYNVDPSNLVFETYPVGGIRVKSIKDCPDSNNCTYKNYTYSKNNHSSGVLLGNNLYKYETSCTGTGCTKKYDPIHETWGNISYFADNHYLNTVSRSMLPLTSYRGSCVLYTEVKEDFSNPNNLTNSNGYIIYNFPNIFLPQPLTLPVIPYDSDDVAMGKLITKTIFDNKKLNPIYEELNDYNFGKYIVNYSC